MIRRVRIAFVTDIHVNATAASWQQQPRWCDGIPAILGALRERVASMRVDLLVFGGDLVEEGTPEAIGRAVEAFAQIDAPALVCLGNHDLTSPDSLACWEKAVRRWPQARLADAMLQFPEVDVLALNNAWRSATGELSYVWDHQNPVPALFPAQLQKLEAWLAADVARPAILALHAPLYPLPAELTGAEGPTEFVPEHYAGPLHEMLRRHPRLRLVLAGHCHAACATPHAVDGQVHLTATSLTEVPCQFPVVEIAGGTAEISMQSLTPPGVSPTFNTGKAWVIGRASDRQFSVPLQAHRERQMQRSG